MASRTYLDTHVTVWLYGGRKHALGSAALRAAERDPLYVSPMVIFEIDLLREIGRVYDSGESMFRDLAKRLGLALSDTPFKDVIAEASSHLWTHDPFDRIIVAEAAVYGSPLVTKDPNIHDHYSYALWE